MKHSNAKKRERSKPRQATVYVTVDSHSALSMCHKSPHWVLQCYPWRATSGSSLHRAVTAPPVRRLRHPCENGEEFAL
jgi:hypothetical protein